MAELKWLVISILSQWLISLKLGEPWNNGPLWLWYMMDRCAYSIIPGIWALTLRWLGWCFLWYVATLVSRHMLVCAMAFFSSLVWDSHVQWLMGAKNQCWSFYWNWRKVLLVVTKCYGNFGWHRGNSDWTGTLVWVTHLSRQGEILRVRQGSVMWQFKELMWMSKFLFTNKCTFY